MFNLLKNIDKDFNENEFLLGFLDAYKNRTDTKGYLHTHADPVILALMKDDPKQLGSQSIVELVGEQPQKLQRTVYTALLDAVILGYTAQVFYVDWVSKTVEVDSLPPLDELLQEVYQYQVKVGEYRPYNSFLDDLTDSILHSVSNEPEFAVFGKQLSILENSLSNYIYSGQVMAVLQGYQANASNLKD